MYSTAVTFIYSLGLEHHRMSVIIINKNSFFKIESMEENSSPHPYIYIPIPTHCFCLQNVKRHGDEANFPFLYLPLL